MSHFEIFVLITLLIMFTMFISLLVGGIIAHERTMKKFMAKSLAEYEALKNKPKLEPFVYKTDETLYYENKLKEKKLQDELKKKIQDLKAAEEDFKFSVKRSG